MPRSQAAGIAVTVAAALGGLAYLYERASTPPQPMERGELLRVTRQLASDARESERLAKLVATGQVNEHYARAHHEKIAEDVHDAQKQLDSPPPQGHEDDATQAAELAAEMKQLLDDAAPYLADRAAMQRLHDEHARIAGALEQLASK